MRAYFMLERVRTPSSLAREREKERERERKRKKERERGREKEIVLTGALAPFSYLVTNV